MSMMRMNIFACVIALVSFAQVNVDVTRTVVQSNSMRLGINLPGPNDYGAENYARNMIPNPGFEPAYWGSVVSLLSATNSTSVKSHYWNTTWNTPNVGWPVGHWTGADWELPLQGLTGKVVAFTHDGDKYTWVLDKSVTVTSYDVMFVRMREAANGNEPHSGLQSRYIKSPGNTWQAVATMSLDALAKQGDKSAGMLRVLRGKHELHFWAKGPATVSFVLYRYPGGKTLLEKPFTLTDDWAQYSHVFDTDEEYLTGETPMLNMSWKFKSGAGFLIDDMFLGPYQPEGVTLTINAAGVSTVIDTYDPLSFFSDTFVDQVCALRPGIIRGWDGGHGDTFENMTAGVFTRAPTEYRTRIARAGQSISYSLDELLALCRKADALPWIVLSPTLSDDDMRAVGVWLVENAADFRTVYVEFANEAWGSNNPHDDPFAGASFNGGSRLGAVAHKKFTAMGEVANVVKVIGGQAAWAGQNENIRKASSNAYCIPIAPYFGVLKERYATPEDMFYPLYSRAYEDVTPGSKVNLTSKFTNGVYEINFHTTGGAGGNKATINSFVASQAGGIALPLYCMLYAREYGWKPMCVFTLAQYSTGGVRMWGVYRDLMATGRVRPTGLAMMLANSAIDGDMVRVNISGGTTIAVPAINDVVVARDIPQIEAFAWRQGNSWTLLLFNLSMMNAENVTLSGIGPVAECQFLYNTDPLATNEDAQTVSIEKKDWDGILPAHSLTVLEGAGAAKRFYHNGVEVTPYDEDTASTILFLK